MTCYGMNYNNLSERSNYIAGSPAFTHIPFFLLSVNIPSMELNHPEVSGRNSHSIKLPADTVKFGTLSFEMLLDEDLIIYQELYDLVRSSVSTDTGTFGNYKFDFFVEVTDNNGHSVLLFYFENCRISSIGSIELDTRSEDTQYTVSVDLEFDRFYIERTRDMTITNTGDPILKLHERKQKDPEDFKELDIFNLENAVLWGLPEPKVIDSTRYGEIILSNNEAHNQYRSGAVYNTVFDPLKPYEFEIVAMQSLSTSDNNGSFLEFGLTEGSGVKSSINGRTGKSIVSVLLDSGNKDCSEGSDVIHGLYFCGDHIQSNPGTELKITIKYEPDLVNKKINCSLLIDDVLVKETKTDLTHHSEIFFYLEGKQVNSEQYIKSVSYC